jgi:hypothetical protein
MTETPEFNFEAEMELRRRLAQHLANWNENLVRTATGGFRDLLFNAHDELLEELLKPLIEWSDFWSHRMAAEILNLNLDDEYDCGELLDLFERQAEGSDSDVGSARASWKQDGF